MEEKEKKYTLCSFNDENGDTKSEIIHDFRNNLKLWGYGGIYTMIGYSYNSIEECKKGEKIPNEPCKKCGSIYHTRYSHKDLSILGLCFSCDLWTKRIKSKNVIIVDHVMYSDGGRKTREQEEHRFLGHGGREFKILMNDGREIETNNLWCGGDIPKRFQEDIPDNAVFINTKLNY